LQEEEVKEEKKKVHVPNFSLKNFFAATPPPNTIIYTIQEESVSES
jgi:hypothetical protein